MSESDPLVVPVETGSVQSSDQLELFPKKTRWELVSEEHVPSYLRSPFITDGYRVHFTFDLCVLSLVKLHNELLNIHTHLLGALGFVGIYIYIYITWLSHLHSWIHFILITCYCASVTWLLLCSACFHCFNCQSPHSFACTARLDYSGIGIVILTSQWCAMTYAFTCWYAPFIAFCSILSFFSLVVIIGPMFKAFHSQRYRIQRALLYVTLSVIFPLMWFLMIAIRYGFASRAVVVEFYMGMGLCYLGYGVGILFYLTRIPERFFPGKFNVFFHSHTLWHLCVVTGAAMLLYSFVNITSEMGDMTCEQLNATWYR